jgi:hypothetical protein
MKIVVLRFNKTQSNNKQMITSYYAACALCNALQDPTFVNNGNLHVVGKTYGESNSGLNVGFFDDDDGIDCIFEAAVKCGFIKQPTDRSKDVYEFLHGTYQEACNFMLQKPLFFFVRYNVGTIINGELTSIQKCVAPVFWKEEEAHYYICTGEGKSPVCRVHNPEQIFFTAVGQKLLTHFISLTFKDDHNLTVYLDGSEIYCVPTNFTNKCHPRNWDNLR